MAIMAKETKVSNVHMHSGKQGHCNELDRAQQLTGHCVAQTVKQTKASSGFPCPRKQRHSRGSGHAMAEDLKTQKQAQACQTLHRPVFQLLCCRTCR